MKRSTRRSSLMFILFAFIVAATGQYFLQPYKLNKDLPPIDDPYKKYWAEVDSLQNLGLTESANKVVNKITTLAEKEKNSIQLIKAFFHSSKYRDVLEEESFNTNMAKLDELLKNSSAPVQQLLYSIKGEVLWNRYQTTMWQINQRTPIEGDQETDMDKWDSKRFAREAMKCYELSLNNTSQLQKTPISNYTEILFGDSTFRKLKPTLYDFLMHRAIGFYSNAYLDILEPAEKFEIDRENYFSLENEFREIKFDAKDSSSSLQKAMKLYQQLYEFHKNDKDPGSIVLLELDRLAFIGTKSVHDQKDDLYLNSLKKLAVKYENHPVVADIYYVLALTYYSQSSLWGPNGDEPKYRDYRKEALKTCDLAIQKYPDSDGANNCEIYKNTILAQSISINIQKAVAGNENILTSITYQNIDKVFIKVFKNDFDKNINRLTRYQTYQEGYTAAQSGTLVKEYNFNVKSFDDYFSHTTEVKLDPLDVGFYTITFSSMANENDSDAFKGFTYFWSTDIGIIDMNSFYGGGQIFNIIDRSKGTPISNAKINICKLKYNYNTYDYDREVVKSVLSDKNGMVKENYKNNESYYLDIKNGKDRFVSENFYSYNYGYDNKETESVRFFLDRGIYRPGQTVNFKLIAVKNDKKTFSIQPKKKMKVAMYDMNYKVISELEITTNDFGTASGSFIIPASVATGSWRLQTDDGAMYFQVEEYKRPKFEVKVDSIPGSCAINDVITVRGSAKALAGFGISDANVTYKVDRLTQMYIYDYYYYQRNSGTKTISTGKLKTNEKGEFEFTFTALPDPKVKMKSEPYYTYTATIDVTDLSGETRSTSFSINVAYKTMNLSSALPAQLSTSDTNSYRFYAYNLSGFEVFTKGSYEIRKLTTPDNYLTTRPFAVPDEPLMSKEEFQQYFPHYPHTDEQDKKNWKRGEIVNSGSFDTEQKTALKKEVWNKLPQGWYVIQSKAKDSKGKEVTAESYFMVYDTKSTSHPFQEFVTCIPVKNYCKLGEKGEILLGTSAEHVVFNLIHEYDGRIIKNEQINMNREQKLLSFPVCLDKVTPYILHIYMVSHNQVYVNTLYFYLDDDSDQMAIELVTFRDKLLPGQDETWKLKVLGNKKQAITDAEVLVNMYDASLDELAYENVWSYYFSNYSYSSYYLGHNNFNLTSNGYGYRYKYTEPKTYRYKSFESLNYFGWSLGYNYRYNGWYYDGDYDGYAMEGAVFSDAIMEQESMEYKKGNKNVQTTTGFIDDSEERKEANMPVSEDSRTRFDNGLNVRDILGGEGGGNLPPQNKPRTNFNETAFFIPHLTTDPNGEVSFSFKVPESLTRWKFRALAFTKDLKVAYTEKFTVTQKEVMITAFAPRFVREGDKIYFSAKVTNLTDKDMNASTELILKDAIQDKKLDLIAIGKEKVDITIKAGESKKVDWYFEVPKNLQALTYTILAKTPTHTDGEENTIPVLTNRILVTEAVPLNVRGDSSKTYTFKNLVNSGQSNTIDHERLTLEVTSNPAWYAIQALPYMMEYPYECAEQTFNRYYSNAIGAHIANSDPRIKKTFDIWKNYQPDALLSNLEKNQELKQMLIEETPWLRDANNETERKRRVGILFDLTRMDNEANKCINKLAQLQVPNGGWSWFDGGPDNRYITQYIISGMGHLKKLGVNPNDAQLNNMMAKGIAYLDDQIRRDYEDLLKYEANLELDHLSYYHIQYLYARSFFKEIPVKDKCQKAYDYYYGQAEKFWLTKGIYMQGMIALAHHRGGNTTFAQKVTTSLKENAVKSEEMGMYWKQTAGWYWWEAPIETQALLIECFDEVTKDAVAVEEMKIWLLKNKQTNDWKTTKATADACYVLLMNGTNLLADEPEITINLGNKTISSTDKNIVKEAGTGYFKTTIPKQEITADMGNIKIAKKGMSISWGAVYWQYFENIDKIPASMNNLQVTKRLFKKVYTKTGNTLEAITSASPIKIGDRVTVRLELKVDRDMEFVHIKDMRASALEPENVISMYKYREGLSYYQSTRDAATNFFIEFMPKGSYVFEYNVRVTHAGEFSNGITTIQCMYAPEFTSHTAGMNIKSVE